jgi:hypothetical protein
LHWESGTALWATALTLDNSHTAEASAAPSKEARRIAKVFGAVNKFTSAHRF